MEARRWVQHSERWGRRRFGTRLWEFPAGSLAARLAVGVAAFAWMSVLAALPVTGASAAEVSVRAAAYEVPTPGCHGVLFPSAASGSWVIPGGGVDVYSNGPNQEGTGADCSPATSSVKGVTAGEEWQCVEFINRLYLTRGWISGPLGGGKQAWPGDAGPAFYNDAPSKLAKQRNGSVSYLGPGDVVIIIVFLNGSPDGGHALVVNDTSDVTKGTVNLVSQNSGYKTRSEPVVTGTISDGSIVVGGGGGGYSYTTYGVVHAPTAERSAPAWKAREAPLPRGSASGQLWSVGCASASACVAVGESDSDKSGWLLTKSGSSWTAAKAPVPHGAATSGVFLASVACPSASSCSAVGTYTNTSGHEQGLLLTRTGFSWKAVNAPLPAGAAANPDVSVFSVACGSASMCVAAGQYTNSAGHQEGLLLTRSGSSWRAARAPLPVGASGNPDTELTSVACPSAASCVAVGSYSASSSYQQEWLLETGRGSSWTAIRGPVPSGASPNSSLGSVACPSGAACVAVGSYSGNSQPLLVTGHGSTWTATTVALPAGADASPSAMFQSVACASAASCVAAGSYFGSSSNQGLLVTGHSSSWTAIKAPVPAGAADPQGNPGVQLYSAACPSATACAVLGQYTDAAGNGQVLVLTGYGSSWTAAKAPLPANDEAVPSQTSGGIGPPYSASVACPSVSACIAVGGYPAKKNGMEGLVLAGPA